MKAFQVYHLNLAFSSIPAASRKDVIERCYWPLLVMAEEMRSPVGVELTGWTLNQIQRLHPEWVQKLKALITDGVCELVGSGWTQMIGPLAPVAANRWNQKLGIEAYESLLGVRPRLALVNEMAYSTSLVGLYQEAGYEGIIMDRDNVRLALDLDHHPEIPLPTHALGLKGAELPVLWSDSILFQRLQRVVHGDIPVVEYLCYLRQRIQKGLPVLPVYCNDAEIFDHRPGRFSTEAKLHPEGEWTRMRRVLMEATQQLELEWVSPSQALEAQNGSLSKESRLLSSAAHPIPVKKQAKYNINRWAVTGRDDLWLNTICHRLHRSLTHSGNDDPESWRALCEFWASDLRTHITPDRWNAALEQIAALESKLDPGLCPLLRQEAKPVENTLKLVPVDEGIYWCCETSDVRMLLNVRRGLTLKSLAFRSHNFMPLLGTLPQGYFDSIDLGADYYTGGVLIELPGERVRLTDLEWVVPKVEHTEDELLIHAELPLAIGCLRKTLAVSRAGERLRVSYAFEGWERPVGIVRVGMLTLMPESLMLPLTLRCHNGGGHVEDLLIDRTFSHFQSASQFVSSTAAMGATQGCVSLVDAVGKGFEATWDPAECAAVPMMKHLATPTSHLTRLAFSLCELDDTSRPGGRLLPFTFTLKPVCVHEGRAS